ncbi:MAG: Gfo/Idh/MocA family oxidoreductase [Planctomycetota bacterium]
MTTLRVAMHGVTGRMGTNQHFVRSILEIIKQGGVKTTTGDVIQVEPVLVGRNAAKLQHLAETVASDTVGRSFEYSTDVDRVFADPTIDIVFDAAGTQQRPDILRRAVGNGKAIYCEKPVADSIDSAAQLADACDASGIKNGVVQDKLWLPGISKLRRLRDEGFFGKILSVRGEFGYWVFSGHDPDQPAQRPSWNYRQEDGGGIMLDMFCHWQYVIEDLFGPIERVLAHAETDLDERIDESGQPFPCTADDSAYALFVLRNGITCQFNSSWATRVRRDDLLTIQVDGTHGSAVAGLRECWVQGAPATPRPIWNPDIPQPINFFEGWEQLPNTDDFDNAFKVQWEKFLAHVAGFGDFPWSIRKGVEGLELAVAGQVSAQEQRWVDVGTLVQ